MALKISGTKERTIAIEATEPLDMGKIKQHKFIATLAVIPRDEWELMFKGDDKPTDTGVLMETLINIDGIVDENDQPVAFDENVKLAVIAEPWLVSALIEQQIAIQNGKTSAEYRKMKLKNS